MALGIPRVVQALFTQSSDASRVRDNIITALQPVLDFCTSTFSTDPDGTLQMLRNIGSLNVSTLLTAARSIVNGDLTINNGNVFIRTRSNNGVVIVPGPGTNPTFYCANAANTDAVFLVDAVGNTSAVSFNSRQGFKSWVQLGSYWNTNTASGDQYFTCEPIIRTGTATPAYIQRRYICIRPGSLTGVSIWHNNTISVPVTWTIYLNSSVAATLVLPANTGGINATYPKGTAAFQRNDSFTAVCSVATGQNFAATVEIEIEEGA